MSSIEQRLQKLEDRAALNDLVATYFHATDTDDYATLTQCFAPDAEFIASGFSGGAGRDGVIAFLEMARSAMGQTVHTPDYLLIEFTGADSATGTLAAHLELGLGAETYFGAVRYLDRYVRLDGRWCIAAREMRAIHIAPWREAGSSLSQPLNVRWPGADAAASDFPRAASQ